ncbi:MAG: hypothetical protein LUH22_10390 [Bacteroides sp.]|nr:hypothetical protein [Bacteroides sp.]
MKTIVSDELKSRLIHAAENGSIIAANLLAELKSGKDVSEVIRGSANYFSTKRKKTTYENYASVKIVFAVCTKDITNKNFPDRLNPQAPWFPENRTEVDPSTFVGYFKNLPGYTSKDLDFFNSAICMDSKVTIKLYDKMNDFIEAYKGENYSPIVQYGETTLHNSCMRNEDVARNAADFYHNFAGAKILVAKDSANNILARSIVWPKAVWVKDEEEETISVMDRVYFTHTFILHNMYEYARRIGIHLRKKVNDYEHACSFTVLNPIEKFNITPSMTLEDLKLIIRVPASKWHKKGAPYLDTFSEIHVVDKSSVELSNYYKEDQIATCRGTYGKASRHRYYCPVCGNTHNDDSAPICKPCHKAIYVNTPFGYAIEGKAVDYNGKLYPSVLFKKGRPIPNFRLYLKLERLF